MSESTPLERSQSRFSKEQIDYLASLRFINNVDRHLRVLSSIKVIGEKTDGTVRVLLILEIYYDNDKTGTLSFDLHNYEFEDVIELAQNIRESEFILHEVDNFLAGDVID